jgi:hypothetical protein
MSRRWSSSLPAAAALLAALALGACGNKEDVIHEAETEGIYLDVGQLKYQVEISRQLNPSIPEDRTFLSDIAPSEAKLAPDELWFAVFVRVENETDQAQTPASRYTITDTQGNSFRPVSIGRGNPFRYTTDPVPAKGVAPHPDSVAGEDTSIAGRELLFRLKRETLDNRPLELTIESASGGDKATDVLDV